MPMPMPGVIESIELIETIEQNEYEDWLASPQAPNPPWSPTNVKPASLQEFNNWASGSRAPKPWTTRPYFDWILRKASGENV